MGGTREEGRRQGNEAMSRFVQIVEARQFQQGGHHVLAKGQARGGGSGAGGEGR